MARRKGGKKVKAKTKELKINNPDLRPKPTIPIYSWSIKGSARKPTQVLTINGKERSFEIGSTHKGTVSSFKANKTITAIFEGILSKAMPLKDNVSLSAKSGYGVAQFGITKSVSSKSWRGLVTYTDGQFCFHSWDEKGLTMAKLAELRHSNGLNTYRQGKNWITISFSQSDVKGHIQMALDVLKVVKAV